MKTSPLRNAFKDDQVAHFHHFRLFVWFWICGVFFVWLVGFVCLGVWEGSGVLGFFGFLCFFVGGSIFAKSASNLKGIILQSNISQYAAKRISFQILSRDPCLHGPLTHKAIYENTVTAKWALRRPSFVPAKGQGMNRSCCNICLERRFASPT